MLVGPSPIAPLTTHTSPSSAKPCFFSLSTTLLSQKGSGLSLAHSPAELPPFFDERGLVLRKGIRMETTRRGLACHCSA